VDGVDLVDRVVVIGFAAGPYRGKLRSGFVCVLCALLRLICVNPRSFHPGECSPESFRGSGLRFVFFVLFAAIPTALG
jgi:hypothetical protein